MSDAATVSRKWLAFAGIVGIGVGVAGATAARPSSSCATANAAGNEDCCDKAHAAEAAASEVKAAKCPVHYGNDGLVADDPARAERLRQATLDGIFVPWTELGRAPTPVEFAERMKLSTADADALLDQMQACGESRAGGILRVPESDLIAVAWPLANVPTGITVTAAGGKPAFARCAIDALGVSEMLGKRTVVEATARDNDATIRISVDGTEVVSAEPPGVVVVRGNGCDNMSFFSSEQAAKAWQSAHDGEGTLLSLKEAVARGAKTFGRYARVYAKAP